MRRLFAVASLLFAAIPVLAAPSASLDLPSLLAGTAGEWRGELQYRDYQTNRWEGLPMTVKVVAQPDGVTQVRTAAFDDGPKVGFVYITTISQLDPASGRQGYAQFRKGRTPDQGEVSLSLAGAPADLQHWTVVATETRRDGNSQAQVRETTTRNGDRLETLKEVNPLDDGKDEWLPRNRTVLSLVRG